VDFSYIYNCSFPSCDNNKGMGFAAACSLRSHIRARNKSRKYNCTVPRCENNNGNWFVRLQSLKVHVQGAHSNQRYNCSFPDCDNNNGKGFTYLSNLRAMMSSCTRVAVKPIVEFLSALTITETGSRQRHF
jgi:hypothetical protein